MTMFKVIKRDHLGEKVIEYTGEVLERGEAWICVRAIFQIGKADIGVAIFRQGDIFTEWFYSDRWYNVFKVQDGATGELKGWYCNITRPAVIDDTQVSADDLAMDVFVNPDGTTSILDEDEFEALNLLPAERQAARQALEQLLRMVTTQHPPFDEIEG